jgi:hypothetical protein
MVADIVVQHGVRSDKLKQHAIAPIHAIRPKALKGSLQRVRMQTWVERVSLEKPLLRNQLVLYGPGEEPE